MPGGRCGASTFSKTLKIDDSGRYEPFCCGNRLAQLKVKKGIFSFNLDMGGTYDSKVLDENRALVEDISLLSTSSELAIVWEMATFIGRHWLLGKFTVELVPDKKSVGALLTEDKGVAGFFPANNTNRFYFKLHLHRFGRIYENKSPLINSSVVTNIPPINSLYTLNEKVRFVNENDSGDWVDITKCWVLIPDQKYIEIDIVSINRKMGRIDVKATLTNLSPKRFVKAYWFTNTEEGDTAHYEPSMAIVCLSRKPKIIQFSYVFKTEPKDPVIQLGAALITNPIANDPNRNAGTVIEAFNIGMRMEYLESNK
ncbi:MAG: hypothetical protein GY820_05250 [Gammaproteobacteria bacterium]|nr:hypothetical protein [Gammaproteobacteria bacterium]